MKAFWDKRYEDQTYVYGTRPNEFLRTFLSGQKPGSILFPAEGEGRNAVFAASQGWEVEAFDFSEAGKVKAMELANQHQVFFPYHVSDYASFEPTRGPFDVVALVYTHAPSEVRSRFHRRLTQFLAPGGAVILEGFSKNQLGRSSGGPKNLDMLLDENGLKEDFSELKIQQLEEIEVELNEGPFHQGLASVVRLIATNDR